MEAGLEAKLKEMFGEEQKDSNAKPVPVRGLPLTDPLSSSSNCPLGLGEMDVNSDMDVDSGPTNAEHRASVTTVVLPARSRDRWLQTEASGDINLAQQMAFGRDILRRTQDTHRR